MAWARKVDTTSREVIAEFRRLGADWMDLSRAPGIDGIAMRGGKIWLVEIKTPTSTGRVKVTKTQRHLLDRGWPIHLVGSVQDVRVLMHGAEAFRTPRP